MDKLLWLLAGHFIGDFPFQSEWMVANKGTSWEINTYHALVYASTIFVIAKIGNIELSALAFFILFASHFIIDPLKARWKIIKSIWIDQLLHFIVLVFVGILK